MPPLQSHPPPPSPCQGLAGLRGLKVLRLAHNQLPSLEGLGRATQLEVLDVSNNRIKDLAGACVPEGKGQKGREARFRRSLRFWM